MFDILMRLSDDEVKGPLSVPVEVWADEVYAGPKPADMESLMGVIRSRNISLIPILQSIAQAQTMYKDHKWKILFDNASTFAFFGSAPGAKETHEYISSLLGKMSVDLRTDGRSRGRNGSSSDTFNRTGRELMFPAEVRRMHRENCILFIEGERPIFDKKNLPFQTQLYKDLKRLGTYEHPVQVIYNEEKMEYRTVERKEKIQILNNEDAKFYREAAKKDERIKVFDIDETEMLYLNWHEKTKLDETEIARLAQEMLAKQGIKKDTAQEESAIPEDVKVLREIITDTPVQDKSAWNLKGSVLDCVIRYAKLLTDEEVDEVIAGLETGLSEQEVKAYFVQPISKMKQYRRAYMLKHRD
jgi:Type IV secretory pathway, VirD4 components